MNDLTLTTELTKLHVKFPNFNWNLETEINGVCPIFISTTIELGQSKYEIEKFYIRLKLERGNNSQVNVAYISKSYLIGLQTEATLKVWVGTYEEVIKDLESWMKRIAKIFNQEEVSENE